MIYVCNSFTRVPEMCILGYTRSNGTLVTAKDLLTNRLAFAELVNMLNGEVPQLAIAEPSEDAIAAAKEKHQEAVEEALAAGKPAPEFEILPELVQLLCEYRPEFTWVDLNNAGPEDEPPAQLFKACTDMMENPGDLQLHSGLTRLGKFGVEGTKFFTKHAKAGSLLKDSVMLTPEADLSFSVPTYSELCSVYSQDALKSSGDDEDTSEEGSIADALAQTGYFAGLEVQSDIGMGARTFASLSPCVDTQHIPVNAAFPYYDSIAYREILLAKENTYAIPIEYIEGSQANNLLPIQPNEQAYYNALVALIREGIAVENSLVTDDEIDEFIKQGYTSTIVDAYLSDLSDLAFKLNWTHTGTVIMPTEDQSANDEDSESEDSVTSAFPGYYTVDFDATNHTAKIRSLSSQLIGKINSYAFVDGFSRIRRYVNFNTMNSYKWAEALIRLLRWGNRKPTCLCIKNYSKDRQEYLDLNKMEPTTFAGSMDELIPVVNPDGTTLSVAGGIWLGYNRDVPRDLEGIKNVMGLNLPDTPRYLAGLVLRTNYVDQEIYRLEFMDVFSAVTMIANDSVKISGISITKENKFEVSPDARASFLEDQFTLSDTIRCARPNCNPVITPSPKLVRTLQAMHGRIQNVSPADINVFRVLFSMNGNSSYESVIKVEEAFMLPDASAREAALQEKRKQIGGDYDNLLIQGIMNEICTPFMRFAVELSEITEDPQTLTLDVLLNTAWDVQVAIDTKTSPVRRIVPNMGMNPVFTSTISKAQKSWAIVAKLPGEDVTTIAGFIAQYISPDNKRKTLFWTADEYTPATQPTGTQEATKIWSTIYKQYRELSEAGKWEQHKNRTIIPATEDTMTKLGMSLFRIVKALQ